MEDRENFDGRRCHGIDQHIRLIRNAQFSLAFEATRTTGVAVRQSIRSALYPRDGSVRLSVRQFNKPLVNAIEIGKRAPLPDDIHLSGTEAAEEGFDLFRRGEVTQFRPASAQFGNLSV